MNNRIEYKYVIRYFENQNTHLLFEHLPNSDLYKNRELSFKDDNLLESGISTATRILHISNTIIIFVEDKTIDLYDGVFFFPINKDNRATNGWVQWTHDVGKGFQDFGLNTNNWFHHTFCR